MIFYAFIVEIVLCLFSAVVYIHWENNHQ